MGRQIAYGLTSALLILSVGGAALGQGMQTFTSEQEAQRHCPSDTVVWLNTSSANYHLKGDPWYGRTQRGAYVCKAEADKNGEHQGSALSTPPGASAR
jgi:hypothetical protein